MEVSLITENVGLIKLAVDLGLAFCLVLCALGWLRRGSANRAVNKLADLESSIRQLIAEAEQAARRVQEDLTVRRQDLEMLLEKARDAEFRLRVGVDREAAEVAEKGDKPTPATGKRAKHNRRLSPGSLGKEQQSPKSLAAAPPIDDIPPARLPHISPPAPPALAKTPEAQLNRVDSSLTPSFAGDTSSAIFAELWQQEPVAPSFREAMRPMAQQFNQKPQVNDQLALSATPAVPKIKEEQLQSLSSLGQSVTASLRGQVEKIIGPASSAARADEISTGKLSEVIATADEMLMRGIDMRTVSRLTGLPLEQVEFLHAVILDEQMAVSRDDPRLGVLAGV